MIRWGFFGCKFIFEWANMFIPHMEKYSVIIISWGKIVYRLVADTVEGRQKWRHMGAMRFKSPANHFLFHSLFRPVIKKHPNSASFPICEENSIVSGDLTNGRWPRSRFHIITSSECGEFAHYGDVIMGKMTSQITSLIIVYSTVYSGSDRRKHQRSAALAFVRGIHRGPVNSPHKWPVTRKLFPFDDAIMRCGKKWRVPILRTSCSPFR